MNPVAAEVFKCRRLLAFNMQFTGANWMIDLETVEGLGWGSIEALSQW
jgi:hypothetical protein